MSNSIEKAFKAFLPPFHTLACIYPPRARGTRISSARTRGKRNPAGEKARSRREKKSLLIAPCVCNSNRIPVCTKGAEREEGVVFRGGLALGKNAFAAEIKRGRKTLQLSGWQERERASEARRIATRTLS